MSLLEKVEEKLGHSNVLSRRSAIGKLGQAALLGVFAVLGFAAPAFAAPCACGTPCTGPTYQCTIGSCSQCQGGEAACCIDESTHRPCSDCI